MLGERQRNDGRGHEHSDAPSSYRAPPPLEHQRGAYVATKARAAPDHTTQPCKLSTLPPTLAPGMGGMVMWVHFGFRKPPGSAAAAPCMLLLLLPLVLCAAGQSMGLSLLSKHIQTCGRSAGCEQLSACARMDTARGGAVSALSTTTAPGSYPLLKCRGYSPTPKARSHASTLPKHLARSTQGCPHPLTGLTGVQTLPALPHHLLHQTVGRPI